ncbi:MAG TPA: HDIG domain-containing protein, partial [Turneriella sp.]|nr:HDIG domain-containing protein [Turneriella sp.]
MKYGATLLISTILLALPVMRKIPRFTLSQVAEKDLKASMDLKIVDTAETERLKKMAYERERPAFDRDAQRFNTIQQQLQDDFSWVIKSIMKSQTLSTDKRIELLKERFPFFKNKNYRLSDIRSLLTEKKIALLDEKASYLAQKSFNTRGYLDKNLAPAIYNELREKGGQIRTVGSSQEIPDVIWSIEQVQSIDAPFSRLRFSAPERDLKNSTLRIILTRIDELMRENAYLTYNPQYTELRRRQAADKVTPVVKHIKHGTILLHAGDVIDAERLKFLEQVRDNHRRYNGAQVLGIFLVLSVLAVSICYFTFRFAYSQVRDYASHFILHGLFWFMFVVALLTMYTNPLRAYDVHFILFVPFGFFGILTGQLFGARIALSSGIYLSIFSYILAGFDNQSLLLSLTSVIAGLYASTRMETRSQMFKGGIIITVTNLVIIAGFELMTPASRNFDLKVAAVIANSLISVLLTFGVLPLLEYIFNMPTPFRLMELNDFNHPLLTRMAAIAPSTHSHSVMLANLSEAAVRSVGGDTLLTRVGCLFHDIGKMVHPDFYAENRHLYPTSESFKKLGHLKSAQMIIRHVTDGIAMARENRLPEKVIRYIPEHHGTTTIQYFYHKALEEAGKAQGQISRKYFQYPGPKPQSKETALVMIADSVEAASRTATSATPAEFEQIIDRIIENKISEEQFHECSLTLGDLARARKAFLDVLVSTY